jgi:hypothetical protein
MPKFRKKPIVVEARQFTIHDAEYPLDIQEWCNGKVRGTLLPATERCLQIDTLEGEMECNVGDWIIKGVKGEFYSCKADIFALTYDPV